MNEKIQKQIQFYGRIVNNKKHELSSQLVDDKEDAEVLKLLQKSFPINCLILMQYFIYFYYDKTVNAFSIHSIAAFVEFENSTAASQIQ